MRNLLLCCLLLSGCVQRCTFLDNDEGLEVISAAKSGDNFKYEILEGDFTEKDFKTHSNVGIILISKKVFNVGDKLKIVRVEE